MLTVAKLIQVLLSVPNQDAIVQVAIAPSNAMDEGTALAGDPRQVTISTDSGKVFITADSAYLLDISVSDPNGIRAKAEAEAAHAG